MPVGHASLTTFDPRLPTTMPKAFRTITVTNELGLHARPAMAVVDAASGYESDVTVTKPAGAAGGDGGASGGDAGAAGGDGGAAGEIVADAKSVMQMITLAATQGTTLHLAAEGPDAEQAVAEVAGLFAANFGEE